MITSELFNIVDRYVQKEIPLEELEDWLVPRLPHFFALPLSPTSDFVSGIELGLAELSNGSRTEEEFRSMLRGLLRDVETVSVPYPEESMRVGTSSANSVASSVAYSDGSELSIVLT